MNKNDLKLIMVIIIAITILFLFYLLNKKEATLAYVYHDNDLVLKIDLNIDNTYSVDGDNGPVIIKVINKKISVIEENSPYHICSKQGEISNVGQSIICLPNKIIIELPDNSIDAEVK